MTQIQERIQVCIAKIIQQNPQVKNIFDEIYQQGGRVLLVGGAVRDCLLGCLGSDLDFEVYHLSFEELQSILEKFGNVSFVGKSYGVLRLHGFDADWSIPRSDSFGRKPIVQLDPDMSFAQAFRRRDVTINSMGIDIFSLELIDPFDGMLDLQKKILRSADITFFVQDPLRLFRVMQFAARFNMKVDETLNQVCKTMDISDVSVERIEQEFTKLFTKSHQPSTGFVWLSKIERLSDIFPAVQFEAQFFKRIDCIAQHYNFSWEQKIIASWAVVIFNLQSNVLNDFQYDKKITQEQTLALQNALKAYVKAGEVITKAAKLSWYLRYIPLLLQSNDQTAYKWLAHWVEPYFNLRFLSEIAACWYSADIIERFVAEVKSAKVLYQAEAPLLSGQDLLQHAQGKELGELLKKAYEIQLDESIIDKNKLLKKIIKNK